MTGRRPVDAREGVESEIGCSAAADRARAWSDLVSGQVISSGVVTKGWH